MSPGGTERRCPKCQRPLEPGWVACPWDGTDVRPGIGKETLPLIQQKVCPRCGAKYDSRARFCAKDGAALVGG